MKREKKKIGELLIEAGLIDDLQLKSSLAYQEQWGGRLGTVLLRKKFVSEKDLAAVISEQCGMLCVSLRETERPPDEVLDMVKADVARKFGIFPLGIEGKILAVAVSDPTDLETLDDISFTLGTRIKPVLVLDSEITRAIETHYDGIFSQGKFVIEETGEPEKVGPAFSRGTGSGEIEAKIERVSEKKDKGSVPAKAGTEVSQRTVIESVIDLLVDKGIFTKEELISRIRSRTRQ
jgi:type IV pilus assembly protein PilB